jgi:hypothetical protein
MEWSGRAPAPPASDAGMGRVSSEAPPCPRNQIRPLPPWGSIRIFRSHTPTGADILGDALLRASVLNFLAAASMAAVASGASTTPSYWCNDGAARGHHLPIPPVNQRRPAARSVIREVRHLRLMPQGDFARNVNRLRFVLSDIAKEHQFGHDLVDVPDGGLHRFQLLGQVASIGREVTTFNRPCAGPGAAPAPCLYVSAAGASSSTPPISVTSTAVARLA